MKIQSMKVRVYEMSCLWSVLSMKCPVYKMSCLWNVRSMKCLVYEMSGLWNVRSMRCPVYEMSGLWIVRLWNVRLWNVHLWNVRLWNVPTLGQVNFTISILRSEAKQNGYSDNWHHCRLQGVNLSTLGGNFVLSQTVPDRDLVRKQLF